MVNKLGKFINKYRTERGLSLRQFGKLADISHTHIDSIEKGIDYRTGKPVKITNETLEKLSYATNTSPSFLLELSLGNELTSNKDLKLKAVRIPVLGRIVAGIPLQAITDIIDYEEIPEEMAKDEEYFALQIRGDSMEPKFSEGDVVIVRKQPDIESGDIAIVLINGEDATIKKVKKHETGIFLVSTNTNYAPKFFNCEDIEKLPITILGKVVELRAKF